MADVSEKVVPVHMLAFPSGATENIRNVKIPADFMGNEPVSVPTQLHAVFHWGQNDFQPQNDRYSVSVGDVIELDGQYYLVAMVGFYKMTSEQFQAYRDEALKNGTRGAGMVYLGGWAEKHGLEPVEM